MGYKKLSDEQEKKLVQEYLNGASVQSLMVQYGYKTKKSILDKVKKYCDTPEEAILKAKQARKNYSINFEKIDSEFKAYFLGLMLTDGYVIDKNKFGIDLTDEDCIAFLSQGTGKEYKTYEQKDKKNRHRLIFYDCEQVENLSRFGVVKNKTLILKGPDLLEEEYKYVPYIIRGIIDGDGTIGKTSFGSPFFEIVSASKPFLQWCKKVLENNMYMSEITIYQTRENFWKISNAKLTNLLKLLCLSYDKPFGMNRKYITLRETFRDYNNL